MAKKMEISIGDYAKHLFEIMVARPDKSLKHWESIRAEAEPLVRKLIELNDKMEGGGYKITGYTDTKGKKKLPDHERIRLAQKKLWQCKAGELKEGDQCWLVENYDHEMYVGEQDPAPVVDVTKNGVYLEMEGCNYEYIIQIAKTEKVLKAPEDWNEDNEKYSNEYWLEQADKLGI